MKRIITHSRGSVLVVGLALALAGCGGSGSSDDAAGNEAGAALNETAFESVASDAMTPESVGDPSIGNATEAAPQGASGTPSGTAPTDAWIGKWVGVEGLALDIGAGSAPGRYTLKIALLDSTSDYEGVGDGESIRFTRDGQEQSIRKATGAETGLKWLADKQNCLMIKSGEGFCRD